MFINQIVFILHYSSFCFCEKNIFAPGGCLWLCFKWDNFMDQRGKYKKYKYIYTCYNVHVKITYLIFSK